MCVISIGREPSSRICLLWLQHQRRDAEAENDCARHGKYREPEHHVLPFGNDELRSRSCSFAFRGVRRFIVDRARQGKVRSLVELPNGRAAETRLLDFQICSRQKR